MTYIPKEQFFRYFRQRLENVRQLSALQPNKKVSSAASFEPEQNILAGAEIDALAKYWALNEGRPSESSAIRMAEFLATLDGKIWNKCSHVDLRERAVLRGKSPRLLTTDSQTKALEAMLVRVLPRDAAINTRVLGWKDDPDFAILKSDATLQKAGVPENFLADSRYGAILYRYYRCAWVHELNADLRLPTDEPIPSDLREDLLGPGPFYMARNRVRRLHIPTSFILQSLARAIDSFERSVPDGVSIALD